jgi:flagellar biosynthesis protein
MCWGCVDREQNPSDSNLKPPPPEERAISVALKEDTKGRAPRVIAAGRGTVAEQILALAFANGVKVREDADLAELLSAVDLDSEIPLEAFTAVAEILSYVYRANGEMQGNEKVNPEKWSNATEQTKAQHKDNKDDSTPNE